MLINFAYVSKRKLYHNVVMYFCIVCWWSGTNVAMLYQYPVISTVSAGSRRVLIMVLFFCLHQLEGLGQEFLHRSSGEHSGAFWHIDVSLTRLYDNGSRTDEIR